MRGNSPSRRGISKAAPISAGDDGDVLYGWKEIVKVIGGSIKNARRIEQKEGLPILRPDKRQKGRVFALRSAILAWMTNGVANAVLSDSTLVAFDRRSRILWKHEFKTPLRKFNPYEMARRLRIVDLHGNGEAGVLFAARVQSFAYPDTLYYFSPLGKIEWQFEADPPLVKRDGTPFERGWAFKDIAITEDGGKSIVWAALGNDAGWAGCVLRIDPDGSARVQFANAGYVERLCPIPTPHGERLIICGENNDFDDSFVALIGVHDPPSVSVAGERLVYRFGNAPTGAPVQYILFPKTELITAYPRLYGHATHITEYLDGIIVEVETGDNGAHFRYHFSKDLEPRYVFPSGHHELTHRSMEERGAIKHSWLECPEMQSPLTLRIWEPDSEWYERPIPWRDNPWKELRDNEH